MTGRALGLVLLLIAASVALEGCRGSVGSAAGSTSSDVPSGSAIELQVYAAASLRSALGRAVEEYRRQTPSVRIALSTDSSAALETKIEQGAPADVFLSADTANPEKLVRAGIATQPVVPFATNTLSIVVPADNRAAIHTPADLARPGVRIVAAGDQVPVTAYAGMLVDRLASLPGYPPDFATSYAANVVSREDNVAAVLAKVALGEGDAGIVYATDARSGAKVSSVPIPDEANVAPTYAGVVVGSSTHRDAARSFLTWLTGPQGSAILAGYGFGPAPS